MNASTSAARSFAAGECYFDLGTAALLHLDALKRKREFTTARASNESVIVVARTSHFSGDVPEVRSAVDTSVAHSFKRP